MSTHDKQGRPWAKLSEVKPGDILIADGGFTCIPEGARLTVREDSDGLYVPCAGDDADSGHPIIGGQHYLEGQADDGEHLVGFYKADGNPPFVHIEQPLL